MNRDVPCRVTADLRAYEAAQDAAERNTPLFDVYDDDLMHDCIGGGKLLEPVKALLRAHDLQWDHYSKDDLKALIKSLRDAVKEEFNNL